MTQTRSEYKSYHEKFMQNHNGSSAMDTFITIIPSFFLICILKQITLYFGISSGIYTFCLEYVVLVIPIILLTTVLADFRLIWFCVSMFIFIIMHYNKLNLKTAWESKFDRRRKWQCISLARSITLLITALSILAVDFKIFPRYLAKTEKYGYSFMDTGVGLFIFCNALVPSKVSRHSLFKSIELNLKNCAILTLLGFGRALAVKEMDYQTHTSEYGVHWNFFLTLAVVKLITTVILCIFRERNSLVCGIMFLFTYEYLLQSGLGKWVFSDVPRINFITSNREGLVSCTGYIGLYLLSAYLGQIIRDKYNDEKESDIVITLVIITILAWVSVYFTSYLGVSRCLANAGYCCFVFAIGTTYLVLFYLYEINEVASLKKDNKTKKISGGSELPIIFSAINENALLFFLLSNLSTGLINLSFQTLNLDSVTSLTILMAYMLFILLAIICFQKKCGFIKSMFTQSNFSKSLNRSLK